MNYPIRATVYVPASRSGEKSTVRPGDHKIERLGGGARSLAEADDNYYPTALWVFTSKSGGPCYVRPETIEGLRLLSVDAYRDGDDPLGVARCWPSTEFAS